MNIDVFSVCECVPASDGGVPTSSRQYWHQQTGSDQFEFRDKKNV